MSDLELSIVVATPTLLTIQPWGDQYSLQPERRYQIDLMDFDSATYSVEHDSQQSILSLHLDADAEYNIQAFVNSTDLEVGIHENADVPFDPDDLIEVSFRPND
jgi:hypothetical protein